MESVSNVPYPGIFGSLKTSGSWIRTPNLGVGADKPDFIEMGSGLYPEFWDYPVGASNLTISVLTQTYDLPTGAQQPSIQITNTNPTDSFNCYYDITLTYQYV